MRFNEKEIKTLAAQHKCEKEGCLYFRERQEGFFRKAEGEIFLYTSSIRYFIPPSNSLTKKKTYKNNFAEKQCVMARPRGMFVQFYFSLIVFVFVRGSFFSSLKKSSSIECWAQNNVPIWGHTLKTRKMLTNIFCVRG